MDKFDTKSQETKRGRGRPPLSPEEKEAKQLILNKKSAQCHKDTDYAAQRKYRENNPDKYKRYSVKIVIATEFKETLDTLVESSGLSLTSLFINAVEEKHNIKLRKD